MHKPAHARAYVHAAFKSFTRAVRGINVESGRHRLSRRGIKRDENGLTEMETILGGVVARVIASMNRRHWTSMLVIRCQSDFFLWDFFFFSLFFLFFFFFGLASRGISLYQLFSIISFARSKLGDEDSCCGKSGWVIGKRFFVVFFVEAN